MRDEESGGAHPVTPQGDADRYIKAWGDRRARLFMLGAMTIGFWVSLQFLANPWIAGLCFAGAMIGAYGYHQFRCPRCGERFWSWPEDGLNYGGLNHGDLSYGRRCRTCGLEKNAGPPQSTVQ